MSDVEEAIFLRRGGENVSARISGPMSQALAEGYESSVAAPDQELAKESQKTVRNLVKMPPVAQAGKVDSASVERLFHDVKDVSHIVIIDARQRPAGLLTRANLYIKTGGAYGYALFANKLADSLASSEFIVADIDSPVSKTAAAAMSRDVDTLYDPIVVIDESKRFAGTVTVKALLESAESAIVKAKQRAEAAAKLKSEFLSAMSHEIRTPLNAIVNMARAIEGTSLDKFQRECAETLSDSSLHLLGVVNNILDFSRLESGKLAMEKASFDLPKLLACCVKAARIQLQGKDAELVFADDGTLPQWVEGDPLRLRQVLLNLLGNAIKFTSKGSIVLRVQFMAKQADGTLKTLFRVSDTGIGIPKRLLPGLFRRFTQAEVSTCRMYGGSGLGLSICRQLVELMGGAIWAESQEGKGSRFSFTISLREGSPEKAVEIDAGAVAQEPLEKASFEKLDALLVEDNAFNVKVAKLLFSEMGHAISCAGNGREALEKLKEKSFDLILTDIEMPEMDGFELARRVRAGEAGERLAKIPIIAISAHVGETWRERCREAGMDAYLSKPVDPSELAALLRRFKKRPGEVAERREPQRTGRVAPQLSDTADFFDLETTRLRSGGNERIVKEMRRIFMEESPSMTRAARKAFAAKDFPALRICAHSLKGNSASVDSKPCVEIAKALEDSARTGDADRCAELLPQLEAAIAAAVEALKRKRPELSAGEEQQESQQEKK